MKKNLIILFTISLFWGCVTNKTETPGIGPETVPNCPDLIKSTANSLEQIGVDKAVVQKWRDDSLALKLQPCGVCIKLNGAIFILNDKNGEYKDALKKVIQAIEEYDPNAAPPKDKQQKKMSNDLNLNIGTESYPLVNKYYNAIDDLQAFLIAELHMSPDDSQNFVLDKFFIPLLKQEEKAK